MMDLKTKRTICLIVGIISILTIVGTISYAYFTATANMVPVEAILTTGTARVRFTDNDLGLNAELNFGESVTKKFTIENTGTVEANVRMYWENLVNTYLTKSLTYTLSYAETEDGPYTKIVGETNVPRSTTPSTKVLAEHLTIPVGKTYYYNLEITLNYLTDVNQDSDLSAVFNTSFQIRDINYSQSGGTLMAIGPETFEEIVDGTYEFYTGEIWGYRETIKRIVFESEMAPKEDAVYAFDISDAQDGSVMSYLVPDGTDDMMYVAYIQADGKIMANENSSLLFFGFVNLESIDNLSLLDTSNVTNMMIMFGGCSNLITLDVSNFDTSNVTNMYGMFDNCSNLTTLDVSNFDTSNVTNMTAMFNECSRLTTLDLSNFDTSNVTDMTAMFGGCSKLTTLDVNNFDTSNVTSMADMFSGCSSLMTLDLSNFDTSNVTSMADMFNECSRLTTLDLSNFDTSNVTNMSYMFSGCSSLTTLDLSNFDTSNVTSMANMFRLCSSLTTAITIRGTKCIYYNNMFLYAATNSNAKITVNYTSDASSLVDEMIADKSSSSNVVKGTLVN